MNAKKILALMLCAMMLLSLAACGAKDNDKQADMSGDSSAMTGEPKTAEEALALHKELLERENAILSENTELWEKVFLAAGIAKEPPPPYTAQCAERLGVPGGRAPVITSPKPGAAIYSPAGFDAARVLLAAGADPDAAILYWYADGAFLGARRVGKALEWSAPAGTHELAVVDDLGRTSTMRLTIRRR